MVCFDTVLIDRCKLENKTSVWQIDKVIVYKTRKYQDAQYVFRTALQLR